MAAFDPNCPCTKECPDRSFEFCKTCEKYKDWKAERAEKAKENEAERDYKNFRFEQSYKYALLENRRYRNRKGK